VIAALLVMIAQVFNVHFLVLLPVSVYFISACLRDEKTS